VFNLELPSNAAHYAHRAGRTGRMGAPGAVISVAAPSERFVIERLAARLGVQIAVRRLCFFFCFVSALPGRGPAPQPGGRRAVCAAPAAARRRRGGGGGRLPPPPPPQPPPEPGC
jgi:hypothetical protein